MTDSVRSSYARLRDEWDALAPERRAALLDDFGLSFAYQSGKIKNGQVSYRDVLSIFRDGTVTNFTGEVRTLFDIRNLKASWDWARGLATPELRLSEELILDAHELVTMGVYEVGMRMRGELPGSFKLENYVSGPAEVGMPAVVVPRAVDELADDVNTYLEEGRRSLTIAAFLHAKLTDIHPFADGNGRVARLLMNMVFLAMGMPPTVVREQDRTAYYSSLDVFHLEGDLEPFKRFLMTQTLLTWEGLLDEG